MAVFYLGNIACSSYIDHREHYVRVFEGYVFIHTYRRTT